MGALALMAPLNIFRAPCPIAPKTSSEGANPMKMSLRIKLIAAFVLNVLLMIVIGMFSVYQMGNMNDRAKFLGDNTLPATQTAALIRGLIHRYRVVQATHIAHVRADELDSIEQA